MVGMKKEAVDNLDLAEESLREETEVMVVHRLKVGVEKGVGDHLDLAEEGLREAAGMI
jgi:hypothetical protein